MNYKEIGKQLDIAALEKEAIAQISLSKSITVDEAYTIQYENIQRRVNRGEQIIGIKMGFTSKAKMEQMGVHDMIWGRLTDDMHYLNGDKLDIAKFIHPRAEPELCFLVSKTIDREISIDEVGDFIEAVAPAIEIIDSRYKNFKFSLEDVIADNCSSSAFVVGNWESLSRDIRNLEVELLFDGETVQKGNTIDILGDPYASIVAASRLTHQYGFDIIEGSYIMAGAATPASYIKSGVHLLASVKGLGEVDLNVYTGIS